MAFPVLLAVGALGAGWVVLSSKRSAMPGKPAQTLPGAQGAAQGQAPGEQTPVGTNGWQGSDNGVQQVNTSDTGDMVYQPGYGDGADPSTSYSPGAIQSDGDTITDVEQGIASGLADAGYDVDAVAAKFGDAAQATSDQASQAIRDLGSSFGMVW